MILNNIRLLTNPVLINAFVYHEHGKVKKTNWGDDINYFFLREICNKKIALYDQYSLSFRLNLKNYLVIGSTIDMLSKDNTEVWGAGLIDGRKPINIKPRKVYAVRGPLTRKCLVNQGIECPEIYGDPALLISRHYKPNIEKKYQYGFIPHVSNLSMVRLLSMEGSPIISRKDTLIINLSEYDKWTDILDQINSCRYIISASLHGLIIAEAYNIPNVWVEFGNPLIGGHFKFHDFFQSIGIDREKPISIHGNFIEESSIIEALNSWKHGDINLQPLINSCPFSINI